jgi:hypothetical protein
VVQDLHRLTRGHVGAVVMRPVAGVGHIGENNPAGTEKAGINRPVAGL